MSKRYQGFAAAREERLPPSLAAPASSPPISCLGGRNLEPPKSGTSYSGAGPSSSSSMLPDFFTQIMNSHGDNLQQMALLAYLKSEDKGKPMLEAITAAKVTIQFYKLNY
jgi:hypothetical protein